MPKTIPTIEGVQPGHETYSQVVEAAGLVFVAGQVGSSPGYPGAVPGGVAEEMRAAFVHVSTLLGAVDLGLEDVVRCVVYLTDMADFAAMDQVFRELFPTNPPVRAAVGASGLARDFCVEVEVTAAR